MKSRSDFIARLGGEFPEDRLTYQKAIPTFHPENGDEAARFIKLANDMNQSVFITGFGNNIDPIGEPFVNMVSIRTDRLNRLIAVEPEDFYVRVGGGYPLRELNKNLVEYNLFTPLSSLPYVGSMGGAIAVNLSGDQDGRNYPMKRYLLQAEIVTPKGEIITPGSVCFKSVSGYDIVKLWASSWGLLGLVITASIRVLPVSAQEEYQSLAMRRIDRELFLSGLSETNNDVDAAYSRKVKAKFDPLNILPIV